MYSTTVPTLASPISRRAVEIAPSIGATELKFADPRAYSFSAFFQPEDRSTRLIATLRSIGKGCHCFGGSCGMTMLLDRRTMM